MSAVAVVTLAGQVQVWLPGRVKVTVRLTTWPPEPPAPIVTGILVPGIVVMAGSAAYSPPPPPPAAIPLVTPETEPPPPPPPHASAEIEVTPLGTIQVPVWVSSWVTGLDAGS